MAKKRITRRTFVGNVAAGAAFTIVPRHVLGRGFIAPSDKLNIACIGCGGKGRSDIDGVASENIYALCDVDWDMALDAFQHYPKAKRFKDYRVMLNELGNEIDAVVIGTPDHTHAVIAMEAMKHGKHVYCEKPLTHTVSEARIVAETARKHDRVTQMGTQIHAEKNYRRVVELVQSGAIGSVREVHSCSIAVLHRSGSSVGT